MSTQDHRQQLIETCRRMNDLGINQGTSGNASVRVPKGFLVTPSAVPYDAMAPDDMVLMDLDGAVLDGARKPSSEWHIR